MKILDQAEKQTNYFEAIPTYNGNNMAPESVRIVAYNKNKSRYLDLHFPSSS